MSIVPPGKRPRVYLERTIDGQLAPHTAPSPTQPCQRCLEGPVGIEGHERLLVRTLAPASVCFQCCDCQQTWTRTYVGEGAFDWNRTGLVVDQGVSLPGKL